MAYSAIKPPLAAQTRVLTKPTTRPFLNYIHNFRALAILFIVAVHTNAHMFLREAPSQFSSFSTALFERSTLLFIFIAGFLFQHLAYKYETIDYWTKKFYNVVVPYILVSIPIILFRIATHNTPAIAIEHFSNFNEMPALAQAAYYYLTGAHLTPFWFIPMVVLYYAAAPFLIKLDEDKRIYYILPLLVILSLLVPRGEPHQIHLSFVHFFSVYMLGMFASRYRDYLFRVTNQNWKTATFITSSLFVATILFHTSELQVQLMYFQKIAMAWFFMFLLWKFDRFIPKQLSLLADMSFGIFFIHYYFLLFMQKALEMTTGNLYLPSTSLTHILVFGTTIACCLLTLFLIKKLMGTRSRYFVGY